MSGTAPLREAAHRLLLALAARSEETGKAHADQCNAFAGVGTAHFGKTGDGGVNRELVESVKTALKVGYRHIDTAEAYSNEASVGVALSETDVPRSEVYITGKVAAGLKDGAYRATIEAQLKKLQIDSLDLYLIHWPQDLGKDGFPTIEEAWRQLEEIKDAGLVKSIGVSNFRKAELQRIVDSKPKHIPTVNQIEVSHRQAPSACLRAAH